MHLSKWHRFNRKGWHGQTEIANCSSTKTEKARPAVWNPKSKSASAARPKNNNSRSKRTHPGVGTTVFPERLGSPCTANTPQSVAKNRGRPMAARMCHEPVKLFRPQTAKTTSAVISSIKRNARFTG